MKNKLWLGAALAAVAIPLAASSVSAHPDIILRDAAGAPIGQTDAYSPKMTCMSTEANMAHACHGSHTDNLEGYMSSPTHLVHKTQGTTDGGEIQWQTYTNTASNHGVVVGRHMQQGRNEDYSITMKKVFKDAYFTSSPGMFGKF